MAHQPGVVLKELVRLPKNPADCWQWLGNVNNNGVPTKTFNGQHMAARRWLWEQLFGKLPAGLIVFSTCPLNKVDCMSPFHFKAGFEADKVRNSLGLFTPAQVRAIKKAQKHGIYARTALAQELGVDPARLHDIWRGRSYGKKKGTRHKQEAAQ